MDNYKIMWESLKKWAESAKEYYSNELLCSYTESVHGERNFQEMVDKMNEIENMPIEYLTTYIANKKESNV